MESHQPSHVCVVCRSTLSKALERNDLVRWDHEHQPSFAALIASAKNGCQLCARFRDGVLKEGIWDPEYLARHEDDWSTGTQIVPEFVEVDSADGNETKVCFRFNVSLARPVNLNEYPTFQIKGDHPLFPLRDVQREVDISLPLEWIYTCASTHRACPELRDRSLPTRLIDVGDADQEPKLVDTIGRRGLSHRFYGDEALKFLGLYVALSHCWGCYSIPSKARKKSFEDLYTSIPFETLPRTFQDAVSVVRSLSDSLGTRYLWIDFFCIIQGDKKDFERECANMYNTFANAIVTICGTEAKDAESGFLFRESEMSASTRSELEVEVKIHGCPVKLFIREGKYDGKVRGKNIDSALAYRAWIVQERLLSARVLFFARNQMYLECASADFFENLKHPIRPSEYPYSKAALTNDTSRGLGSQWKHIVEEYTMCDLTYGDDRLPALSGTASRMGELFSTTYHAGLWRKSMVLELAWARNIQNYRTDGHRHTERRNKWQATVLPPSWSWASCEYGIVFSLPLRDDGHFRKYIEILDCFTPTIGLDPFGMVDSKSAYVRMSGPCQVAIAGRDASAKRTEMVESQEQADWIYCEDDQGALLPIARFARDSISVEQPLERVLVMLIAAQWDFENNGPLYWVALVLRATENASKASSGIHDEYRRIGLLTEVVRQPSPELDDILGQYAAFTQIGKDSTAWEWMQSGSHQNIIII